MMANIWPLFWQHLKAKYDFLFYFLLLFSFCLFAQTCNTLYFRYTLQYFTSTTYTFIKFRFSLPGAEKGQMAT